MFQKFLYPLLLISTITYAPLLSNENKKINSDYIPTLEKSLDDNFLGVWSINIFDLSNDSSLYKFNSELHLIPASNQKIVTTAAALKVLGTDFRYKNSVSYSGKIEKGVLNGDLHINSFGDPTIGKNYFKSRKDGNSQLLEVAKYIKDSLKITTIKGDIKLDNIETLSSKYGKGWEVDDISNYYAAPLSNYNFNENVVKLKISNKRVTTDPPYPLKIKRIVDSDTKAKIYRDGSSDSLEIVSDFKKSYNKFVTVSSPSILFKNQFESILNSVGIKVKGRKYSYKKRKKIIDFYSDSLLVMLKKCNSESNNFYAEQLYRATALDFREDIDSIFNYSKLHPFYRNRECSKIHSEIASTLFGVDIDPADGSGLSRYNLLTTNELVAILKQLYHDPIFPQFLSTLAKPGYEGTLESKFISPQTSQQLFGKTGSMTNVYSFSGYLVTNSGKNITFSIINNNSQSSKRVIIQLIMEYLEYLILKY